MLKNCFLFLLLLAFAGSLTAQVTTRLLDSTAIVGPQGYTNDYNLDVDLNGVIDYTVEFDTINLGLGTNLILLKIVPSNNENQILVPDSTSGRALLVDNATTIGSAGIWLNFIPTFTHWAAVSNYNQGPSANNYNFDPFECKYIGLNFKIDSSMHFGWLRVEKDTPASQKLILKEVGYELSPNTSLSTGTTCIATARSEPAFRPMIAYPNPTTDVLYLDLEPRFTSAEIVLYDALGRRQMVPLTRAQGQIRLNLQGLPAGVYVIEVGHEQHPQRLKIIKE